MENSLHTAVEHVQLETYFDFLKQFWIRLSKRNSIKVVEK